MPVGFYVSALLIDPKEPRGPSGKRRKTCLPLFELSSMRPSLSCTCTRPENRTACAAAPAMRCLDGLRSFRASRWVRRAWTWVILNRKHVALICKVLCRLRGWFPPTTHSYFDRVALLLRIGHEAPAHSDRALKPDSAKGCKRGELPAGRQGQVLLKDQEKQHARNDYSVHHSRCRSNAIRLRRYGQQQLWPQVPSPQAASHTSLRVEVNACWCMWLAS